MKINPASSLALLAALAIASAPLRASETDDRIESSARKSHVFKTHLKDDAIQIQAKDGAVTLTGTVVSPYHKALAGDTVESLPGVRSVDNQLTIKGETVAEHSDGWLSTKVKTTLLLHRNVSASKTDVFTKDGIVTLRGEATSEAQRELAAEYARDIEGVKEVKNEMTVAGTPVLRPQTSGEKLDDASITAQVKSSLRLHRSTSNVRTKVETLDGVVTLTGVAKNAAEKSLVTKLVNDIHGVVSVANNMTIALPVVAN